MEAVPQEKLRKLQNILKNMDSAVLAFSGGADSAFLAAVACDVSGLQLLAVTACWEAVPQKEIREAADLARELGLSHQMMAAAGLKNKLIAANTTERCYHCKTDLMRSLWDLARERGYNYVLVGDNADDAAIHRPGRRAVREWGARSPLLEAGLSKAEIRQLSRVRQLSTWDKPAQACLASRFPYGDQLSAQKLAVVEKAESIIRSLGIGQLRVRHHGELARVEVDSSAIPAVTAAAQKITTQLQALGYRYVTLDLQGFRSGSLDEGLPDPHRAP